MRNAYLMLLALLSVEGLFGAEADSLEIKELTEGDSIKLDTCVTKIQKDDEVEWKFGSQVIATIKGNKELFHDTDDAIFKDKLQIDDQTGDLTIRNTRIKHSGLYEVKIVNATHKIHKTFSVTVLDPIPKKVSVTEGDSVTLQYDIADLEIYDVIVWMFEGEEIARINKKSSIDPSYNKIDERFKGRLNLDQTGSLTITNSRTTDAGLYKLQVMGQNKPPKDRKVRLTVSESGPSTAIIVIICVSVAASILSVVVIYFRCQKRDGNKENGEQDPLKGQ